MSDRERFAEIKRDMRKKLAEDHEGGHEEELGEVDKALCPLCEFDQNSGDMDG